MNIDGKNIDDDKVEELLNEMETLANEASEAIEAVAESPDALAFELDCDTLASDLEGLRRMVAGVKDKAASAISGRPSSLLDFPAYAEFDSIMQQFAHDLKRQAKEAGIECQVTAKPVGRDTYVVTSSPP